uniref:Uncharacterized protein n=1 Tax=Arundo donax TaxID=35708 RepID=A0A0A9C7Y5_ARUDO
MVKPTRDIRQVNIALLFHLVSSLLLSNE